MAFAKRLRVQKRGSMGGGIYHLVLRRLRPPSNPCAIGMVRVAHARPQRLATAEDPLDGAGEDDGWSDIKQQRSSACCTLIDALSSFMLLVIATAALIGTLAAFALAMLPADAMLPTSAPLLQPDALPPPSPWRPPLPSPLPDGPPPHPSPHPPSPPPPAAPPTVPPTLPPATPPSAPPTASPPISPPPKPQHHKRHHPSHPPPSHPPPPTSPPPLAPTPLPPGASSPYAPLRGNPSGMVAALNHAFDNGRASADIFTAGLIVRQFDKLSAHDSNGAWLPCPSDYWCGVYHAQWPTSLVNTKTRSMYYSSPLDIRGGLVLDPTLVRLFCIYARDGNSMAKHCNGGYGDGDTCIPGCSPKSEMCARANANEFCGQENSWCTFCSFAPTDLAEALKFQEGMGVWPDLIDRGQGGNNNEFVVDTRSIDEQLPQIVLAFFYRVEPTHDGGEEDVRNQRAAFLRAYHLSESAVPLVRLDVSQPAGVFTLVS